MPLLATNSETELPPQDLRSALAWAHGVLADAGVPSPDVDALALAAHVRGESWGETKAAAILGANVPDSFAELVALRATRVPLQHITGEAHFLGHRLAVGPGVFVPRPETESLAQWAMEAMGECHPSVVVDACSGSGALAVAMSAAWPSAHVHAVELDAGAVPWTRRNAEPCGVDVHHADIATWGEEHSGTVDVVVSNPPYIPPGCVPREPEVHTHDPELALYGLGHDGLAVPRRVIRAAHRLLRPGGILAMEHAESQQLSLLESLTEAGWQDVCGHQDLAGRPRFVTARQHSK